MGNGESIGIRTKRRTAPVRCPRPIACLGAAVMCAAILPFAGCSIDPGSGRIDRTRPSASSTVSPSRDIAPAIECGSGLAPARLVVNREGADRWCVGGVKVNDEDDAIRIVLDVAATADGLEVVIWQGVKRDRSVSALQAKLADLTRRNAKISITMEYDGPAHRKDIVFGEPD